MILQANKTPNEEGIAILRVNYPQLDKRSFQSNLVKTDKRYYVLIKEKSIKKL
jgi:hypothetical protein